MQSGSGERTTQPPPVEVMPDLIAGALARRDINEAIRLLEDEKDRGGIKPRANITLLLAYVYCLNGSVDKAEALPAANNADSIKKDSVRRLALGKIRERVRISSPCQLMRRTIFSNCQSITMSVISLDENQF